MRCFQSLITWKKKLKHFSSVAIHCSSIYCMWLNSRCKSLSLSSSNACIAEYEMCCIDKACLAWMIASVISLSKIRIDHSPQNISVFTAACCAVELHRAGINGEMLNGVAFFIMLFSFHWALKALFTFIHWWQRLPCKVPTCSSAAVLGVQYLAGGDGYLNQQPSDHWTTCSTSSLHSPKHRLQTVSRAVSEV